MVLLRGDVQSCKKCTLALSGTMQAHRHVALGLTGLYWRAQYMHIPNRDQCNWLRERIETSEPACPRPRLSYLGGTCYRRLSAMLKCDVVH